MTSKLVVNTIEADTGISSVSFASSISMSSTSVFHFGDAGVNIGADTNISRLGNGILGFNINGAEKARIDSSGHIKVVGVVTATHFYGDGSNLTGITAGLSNIVEDTSPQLGGDLASNSNDILMAANDRIVFGSDALRVKHTGSHADIENTTGNITIKNDSSSSSEQILIQAKGGEDSIKAIANGAVELYHNNLKKFETTADGIKLGDAVKLSFNDYSYIWDNNTNNNTYWMNASNSTFIDVATTGKHIGLTAKGTAEAMVNCYADGAVELYHNNTKRLETTSAGVKVTGHLSFNSSSQGIDFSASAHSSGMQNEVLDDYERGSWTPSFWNAATGGTQLTNPSNTQASYVKVGRIVYLHLGVHGLTKNWAGSNTQVFVRGIPYRSYFQHNGHCVRGGFWGANDDDMNIYANLRQYDYYMEFQKGGGAQGRYDALYWSDMHWEGYGNLTCEMTYETDQGV